jgi:hypothetical protein
VTTALTARQLLKQLGAPPQKRFEIRAFMGSSVRVHLKLFSHGRPTWGLDVQDLRASQTRNTWLKEGGLVERDDIGLPPLANLASVPTWLKVVERQLKVDLEIAGATFEVGRAKSIEPLLRSWLAPGAAAPAKPTTLAEWARGPRGEKPQSPKQLDAELDWVARHAQDTPASAAEARMIAEALVTAAPAFVSAALRGGITGVLRKALAVAVAKPELHIMSPLYHHVLAEMLRGKTPIERIDEFARLATRYSHLPGMLKQRQRLVFPEVVTAAIGVARRWSAISRKDPCDLDLPDYAVLIALASDRRAPVDAALASIVRGQQLAAKLQGDTDWACDDVVSRIRAAVRK